MQDACHMNLLIDLAHCGVCGPVVEHQSVESEGLRFLMGIPLGDSIFSLSHACEMTKNIFLYLKYMLGTDHAEYKDTQENINFQKLFQNVAVIEMQPLSFFYLKWMVYSS